MKAHSFLPNAAHFGLAMGLTRVRLHHIEIMRFLCPLGLARLCRKAARFGLAHWHTRD